MTDPRQPAKAGDPLTFITAIARQEGFGVNGSRATRNNNPGNIESGPFTKQFEDEGSDGRFAHFANPGAGYNALRALLKAHYLGLTVAQALNKYAPPVENLTNIYIAHVCEWTGLTAETVLTQDNIG